MGKLSGKVAIVTGGASGMGRATVMRFLGDGAKVVVGDLNEANGAETVAVARAGGHGDSIAFVRCDVSREADVAALVSDAVKRFGRLDIAFLNAGVGGAFGPIGETSVEDWDYTFAVLVRSVFLGMKHGIAAMKKGGRKGSVINLSSISGIVGQGYIHVGYNASKGAVRLITKAGAAQHGKDGIRVNSVHPGLMPPMRTSGRTADPASRAKTLKGVPMGRAGEVDEVAYAILFLASDEASYVTGAELVVDGGWTAV